MLCSQCSKRVKPIVAVDIDGTLGDYHSHFLDFARNWIGLDGPEGKVEGTAAAQLGLYDGSKQFRKWFESAFGVDKTTYRLIKLAYRQGGMKRTMPPYPEMIFAVQQWKRAGAEVWVTTTRPFLRLDGV